MSSSESAKVTGGGDVAVDSETTVEIKIKTLDSQTYTLRVDKCVPVPALKEQIASVTGVLSERQRLICRGKVLKDDQLLSAYHVEDGHTLHLVVREPHQLATPSTNHMGSEGASGSSSAAGSAHNHGSQVAHSFVLQSVNGDQGDIDTSVIGRIISSMLESLGSTSTGTGNMVTGEMISERLGRAYGGSGLSDSSQAHPNPSNPQSDRGLADLRPSSAAPLVQPTVIPDSLTTLSQYIGFMMDEFRREGFGSQVNDHINNREANGVRSHDSHLPAAQIGLPTPASLAEVLLSTRQLLMQQTGECLSQLARQLEDHTNITDPLTRLNMQASAMRSGVLMRNLGSFFLELGRATMTLRMGQSPAEAIVNAGPANFISATGPNPLMVQAVPFPPGSSSVGTTMGPANSGHVLGGEPHDVAFLPRNIEIRIRTARAVPVTTTNASEQATASHEQQEQTDASRNSSGVGTSVVRQAFQGGDSGVRVVPVPLRTVVAVPTGVNASSDSSTSSVRVIYPVVARVRQTSVGNASDMRGSQASTEQPLPQSSMLRENLESNSGGAIRGGHFPPNAVPFASGFGPSANEPAAYQAVFVSSQQSSLDDYNGSGTQSNDDANRGTESNDATSNEQGVFLSDVLRGLMPLISQGSERVSSTNPSSSTAQTEGENLNGPSSSQHHHDPADAPSPKRPKRNGD